MNAVPNASVSAAQAVELWRSGRHLEAQWMCEALVTAGEDAEALSLLAEIHVAAGRPAQAVDSLQRLIRARAPDAATHRRLGNALLASGDISAAVDSYREAVKLDPHNVRGHNNLGQALVRLGRCAEASASYERAIELDPRYAIAHNNLGIVLYEQGEYERAVACYGRAIGLDGSFAEAHYNCGNALQRLDRAEAALERYDRALALRPVFVEALFARCNSLQRLKRFEAAVESYERALAIAPDRAAVLSNCASVLLTLQRPEEALRCCERAIALEPDFAEAYNNLAGALRSLHRYDEAAAACDRALQLKPDYAAALSNFSNILLACHRLPEAIDYCRRAIVLAPQSVEARSQLGWALTLDKRLEEAVEAYTRLLEIAPEYPHAIGFLMGARQACCDWSQYDEGCSRVIRAVREGKLAAHPFGFLAISESLELQLRCAQAFAADQLPSTPRLQRNGGHYERDRIRIAYLSADFHQHATAMLMAGLFEAHDRAGFETVAISFGPSDSSAMRLRLERAFDRFIDVREMSDAQVVQLMQSLEIDIAVDLKGYTGDSRPGIVARRPAPVQVNYLGYPGTMGLDQVDYIVADRVVLPPEHQVHYSERAVYLPECYQVNDDKRVIAERTPPREELGLPPAGFVFCCFNNHYKITPVMFDIWMQLLQRVSGSVLWLLEDNAAASRNLRSEAEKRAVNQGRLVFARRCPPEEHLARQRRADLFLDTLPYNAHTTTSDALWAGLPVLTCLGSAFPGRVAASLLSAVGLPELITHSLEEYAARAVELASDKNRLSDLRARLARNRDSCPLFDTARFCRHLEAAYTLMWRRHQDGLPPETFTVPPLAADTRV